MAKARATAPKAPPQAQPQPAKGDGKVWVVVRHGRTVTHDDVDYGPKKRFRVTPEERDYLERTGAIQSPDGVDPVPNGGGPDFGSESGPPKMITRTVAP